MYHATSYDNLFSIFDKGLELGSDGLIYLTNNALEYYKEIL